MHITLRACELWNPAVLHIIVNVLKHDGLVRDLNPGPLAPKARIIPLDQRATLMHVHLAQKLIATESSVAP